MFDPFKDFDTAGYLRNIHQEKDLEIVKEIEHELFRANLFDAVNYLSGQKKITYEHFLKAHHILFIGFYPWAGQDRSMTAPDSAISKGDTFFSHPQSASLAVQSGLNLGQDHKKMRDRHGEVMGLFAYGHPFLDGNGRTMLLVHTELCRRAGFSINWHDTNKNDYLNALTQEIAAPGKRILDNYLQAFIAPVQESMDSINSISTLQGLNGSNTQDQTKGNFNDPAIAAEYQEFEQRRGYEIK